MFASIIVPVKDNLIITQACLDSLKRYTKDCEIIVVNDGSKAETTEYLKSLKGIVYFENKESEGWCRAINKGIEAAIGDYLIFANNDVVVTPGWLDRMAAHFNTDDSLGALGPVSNQVDGYQHIDFNKKDVSFQYTDVLTFFLVMVRREVLKKIGVLDERFGLGGQDDADFCIRVRQAGFKVGIARDVFVYHYGSATFRNILKNDIARSREYAKSRVGILRDKYKDQFDDGVIKRVFIAIPNGGRIVTELLVNLISWSHSARFEMFLYAPKNMFPLDAARNHCVEKFLQSNCDYLLWIDDDIVPPLDTIDRFLKADKDIIGAVCFSMKYEDEACFPYPVTLRYNEDKKYIVYYGSGVEEVDATGGACVMFKRKVYEAIERPYAFQYNRSGSLSLTCDFDVFQKAQKAGFKVYVDFGIVCDHLKEASLMGIQNTMLKEAKC